MNETPVDEPPKARLFREGKTILVALGVSEKRSGSVIGRWLKTNPDAVGILAALEYAYKNNVIEPIAYVTKLLNTGGKTNGKRYDDLPSWERGKILAERARDAERQAGIGRPDEPVRSH
jgi:hypothetical protein